MDRERLGRVLGRGARLAAQTAYEAVDAATSSPPQSTTYPARPAPASPVSTSTRATAGQVQPQVLRPKIAAQHAPLLRAAKAAGSGFAGPLRRASRALWLELTGCFFALFALSFGLGAWHTRADALRRVGTQPHRFAAFCLLSLLFAYFSLSSFLRARQVH